MRRSKRQPSSQFMWWYFVAVIAGGLLTAFFTGQAHAATTTVTLANMNGTLDEADLSVDAAVAVTITLAGGAQFDQFYSGAGPLPTVPPLGGNNDGVLSATITVQGPISGHIDMDGPQYVSATATVNGVTKPLVQSETTYSATFDDSTAPPPVIPPPVITPPPTAGNGTATLNWTAPTQNTDKTPLTDLAGFVVYWGTAAGSYPSSARIGSATTLTYVVTGLADGTWYFAVTAVNSAGLESAFSNPASITLAGSTPPPITPPPVIPPPVTPPPSDPCVTTPLAVPTNLAWPSARSGRRTLGWNSPATIVALAYAWPIGAKQTATWTDDRGCTVTVTH